MRQHIGRWFRVGLWLVPVLGLCIWTGYSALPSLEARDLAGPLCSAATSAVRAVRPASAPLRQVSVGRVETVPGMPAVPDPKNLYGATASDRLAPAVAGTPTRIYVPEVTAMFAAGLRLTALIHLTGDGFFNLTRTAAPIGYLIHTLPPTPPIFAVLQQVGRLSDAEMCQVYNLGIGFCVVVAEPDAERVLQIAAEYGTRAWRIGTTVASPERTITIEPRRLQSREQRFVSQQ